MNKNLNSRGIPKPKEVEPIKKLKDIEKIKQYLKGKDNRRDYMLFVLGINVDIATVSRRLGHSNINTTLNIYTHALTKLDRTASDSLRNLFQEKSGIMKKQS